MIPNPIRKVLSTFQNCGVRALLMGGQACVFYGAAEFSRNTDFVLETDPANLDRLNTAMNELRARVIAVPPMSLENLNRGHAIHFRCQHPKAAGLRVDLMSSMRGVAPFHQLWERRTTLQAADGTLYELMSLPDLVQAKKTQRDKDWPMIRRLIEADHAACTGMPSEVQVDFWLRECRTPELLLELARCHRDQARSLADQQRPLLSRALEGDVSGLEDALAREEATERAVDRAWWVPLRLELERMRHPR